MRLADHTTYLSTARFSLSFLPPPPSLSLSLSSNAAVEHQICARARFQVARVIKRDVYKKRINRPTTITLSFNESALHSGGMAKKITEERTSPGSSAHVRKGISRNPSTRGVVKVEK